MATITEIGTAGRHRALPRCRWITDPGRAVLFRIAAGIHRPSACRYTDPIRSYPHAVYVRDMHRHHHSCPRFAMADAYLAAAAR